MSEHKLILKLTNFLAMLRAQPMHLLVQLADFVFESITIMELLIHLAYKFNVVWEASDG
jgi:hypothetical protein